MLFSYEHSMVGQMKRKRKFNCNPFMKRLGWEANRKENSYGHGPDGVDLWISKRCNC